MSNLSMLEDVYRLLDLDNGQLLKPNSTPTGDVSAEDWRAAGEWLILAERMSAERVFFVQDNPVIVFSSIDQEDSALEILRAYRRAWSMARPRCLFIATNDEIRVYALSDPPVDSASKMSQLAPLEIVARTADVAEQLAEYQRERIEDGRLFQQPEFGPHQRRADQQFLLDVQIATKILESRGLPQRVAHGLIERVVLIRYLEDREVLTPSYFEQIASRRKRWRELLDQRPAATLGLSSPFLAGLDDIDLTRAVFSALARDFNGDLFVVSAEESALVTAEHLESIKQLFSGEGFEQSAQEPLFLWAYDFSVVPTSLISSMYEQFYHADSDDDSGTYYTPSELVEYALAKTLTADVLDSEPRICDAACGSGIFLVEAFRRVVRHEMVTNPSSFGPERLRSLLVERVAGIDTNAEAIRLAAFSLYLAYLNYLSPRDILSAEPLPRLISRGNIAGEATVLVISDAFNETSTEASDKLSDLDAIPWANGSFDVVVGNPPWTEPRSSTRRSVADRWARERGLPVGDRSPSQLFLWRALSLLREGGTAGLLVQATAFHNLRSRAFRSAWLSQVELESFVNFTPVRKLFFHNAIAPFALVQFKSGRPTRTTRVEYSTMIPSDALISSGSISYARTERKWISQDSLMRRDYLWKTYFWGNKRDDTLMARLDTETRLVDVLNDHDPPPGYGFQWGNLRAPTPTLANLPLLNKMESWGPLRARWLGSVDRWVKREPDERLYFGPRLLISRGVRVAFGPRARFEDRPMAFSHSFYCVPTPSLPTHISRALVGILLSSVGRYRLFMTSPSWGIWHDQVTADDIKSMPVRIAPEFDSQLREISDVVAQLQPTDTISNTENADEQSARRLLETLNRLVYDLFELTPAERSLVDDFDRYTLDLATYFETSAAVRPVPREANPSTSGTRRDLSLPLPGFGDYVDTFLSIWDPQLQPDGEFSWQVIHPNRTPMVAAVFQTKERAASAASIEEQGWPQVLSRLARATSLPLTESIRTEGVVRAVSDTDIVIVKRDEARLWSRSAAIDDAEATMLQAMALGD